MHAMSRYNIQKKHYFLNSFNTHLPNFENSAYSFDTQLYNLIAIASMASIPVLMLLRMVAIPLEDNAILGIGGSCFMKLATGLNICWIRALNTG
jgi:hypothetical protein